VGGYQKARLLLAAKLSLCSCLSFITLLQQTFFLYTFVCTEPQRAFPRLKLTWEDELIIIYLKSESTILSMYKWVLYHVRYYAQVLNSRTLQNLPATSTSSPAFPQRIVQLQMHPLLLHNVWSTASITFFSALNYSALLPQQETAQYVVTSMPAGILVAMDSSCLPFTSTAYF